MLGCITRKMRRLWVWGWVALAESAEDVFICWSAGPGAMDGGAAALHRADCGSPAEPGAQGRGAHQEGSGVRRSPRMFHQPRGTQGGWLSGRCHPAQRSPLDSLVCALPASTLPRLTLGTVFFPGDFGVRVCSYL